VVQWLLSNKADINAKDNGGKTALGWAVSKGHADVAELLRQRGGHE
jgi:ankyrin repeat protein